MGETNLAIPHRMPVGLPLPSHYFCRMQHDHLRGEIERLFPQVEQIVAQSDFGREAIEKVRTVVDRAKIAVQKRDLAALREQIEGLGRTQRMFKGVVAKTL